MPTTVTYELTALVRSLTELVKQFADWSLANKDAIAASRHQWDNLNPGADVT